MHVTFALLNYIWALTETFSLDVALQMYFSPTFVGFLLLFLPISTFPFYSHESVFRSQADWPQKEAQYKLVQED